MRVPTEQRRRILLVAVVGVCAAWLTGTGPTVTAQDGPPASGPTVGGRLIMDGEPLQGVRVVVSRDGDRVGTATSGPDGGWRLALPGDGAYEATLDQASLPEGVAVRDAERATLPFTVSSGQQRTLVFSFGDEPAAVSYLRRMAQAAVNGIKFGLIIAMTAIGLSLVYGTTRLVNFAHGDMVTFGAMVALLLNTSGPSLQLIPAGVVAVASGAALGAGMESGLWRPLRRRRTGLIQLLVISIGLAMILRHVILLIMGGRPRPYHDYTVQAPVRLGPVLTTPRDLVVIAVSTVVLVGIGLLLLRTRIGRAMRAVADNRDLAASSGVDVQRVILFVWAMAGALAALGGVLLGVVENVEWLMGFRALLLMFAAVILGGLGTAFGAMAGGIVVGLATEISTIFQPSELKTMWALIAMVVVLLVRPQGILGRRERIG